MPRPASQLPRILAVVALAVLGLMAFGACKASAADDPRLPASARPLIRKLEKAGLKIEVLGPRPNSERKDLPEPIELAINGRDAVFVYEYEEPQSDDVLWEDFNAFADFAVQNYPVVFRDGKLVLLVRGNHDDTATRVYTALWDARPEDLLPLGLPPTDYYGLHRPIEFARVKLGWRISEMEVDPALGDPEIRLIRLGDYLDAMKVDERLLGVLPHPDTLVIAVMSNAPDRSRKPSRDRHVVLVTYGSELMIAVDRTVDPSKVRALPALPIQDDDY